MKKELRALAADLACHLKTLDEDTVAAPPHAPVKRALAPEAGAGKTADGGIGEKPEVRSQKSDRLLTAALPPLTAKPPLSLSAVTEQVKAAMEELSAEVKACRKCPLGHARLNTVFGVGSLKAQLRDSARYSLISWRLPKLPVILQATVVVPVTVRVPTAPPPVV